MKIPVPSNMDYRKSDDNVLDLLVKVRDEIDFLADKFPMLATNSDVIEIYAKVDGAVYKLMQTGERVKGDDTRSRETRTKRESKNTSTNPNEQLGINGVAKLVWGFLTDEENENDIVDE